MNFWDVTGAHPKLAGERRFRDSAHQKANRSHGRVEERERDELTKALSSSRERARSSVHGGGNACGFGEIYPSAARAARASFCEVEGKTRHGALLGAL